MAWIESHQELASHPKTLRLARLLGDSLPATIGRLHLLWWWSLSYAPNGDLSRFEDDELATPMLWEGDPAQLRQGLVTAGFVNTDGSLHDWHEYAGRLVNQRALTREQRASGGRNRMAQLSPEERSMLAKQAAVARWMPGDLAPPSINMPATVPNSTVPNSTQPVVGTIADNVRQCPTQTDAPPPPKAKAVRSREVTPEYLTAMAIEFPMLNVDRIYRLKFAPWCKQKGIQETQLRLVGWLERDAKAVPDNGNGRTYAKPERTHKGPPADMSDAESDAYYAGMDQDRPAFKPRV